MSRFWAIVRKDLLIERRSKATFNAMAFFGALVLFLFSFAVGADRELLERAAPGLLWVAIFFTGILALERAFQLEDESGGLEALRLYPADRRAIYLGKMVAILLLVLAMEAVLIPMAAILYNLDLWPRLPGLLGVIMLGTIGFVTVGTFYAGLTVHVRAREVMLPLLLLPILVPVVLGAVKAMAAILEGDPLGELRTWVSLLAGFDVVYLIVCTLGFEYVMEE
ncbi:MAG: heme exporter protein CcmB [Gemmatimonadetes bacterium]|nr:heme exporter protein CcmB [Gemmatimonadota bacterium]